MKTFIILFLLIFNAVCQADQSLTYSFINGHTFAREESFKNKIDSKGALMYNPIISYSYNDNNFIVGKDSIDSSFLGYYKRYNHFIIGLYSHNIKKWDKVKLEAFNIQLSDTLGLIPIVGLEYKQNLFKNIYLKEVITPATFSIGISVYF